MKKILSVLVLATLLCALLSLWSCSDKNEPMSKTYYEYFDTVTTVTSYGNEDQETFSANAERVRGVLERYHRLFDVYYEYEDMNNLKTVNDNAGISPITVDREIIELLLYAKEIYTLTDGETNAAMGPVISLWQEKKAEADKSETSASVPAADALSAAAKHISPDSIIIDEAASTVYLSDKNGKIDVGAIGKGYATERAAEALRAMGVSSYVLNVGGNIRAVGEKPDGKGWVTGITDPKRSSEGGIAIKLIIKDVSCVTSGNYERYFTVDGKRYHHIIDKDTLYPAEYFASVTVITKDSGLADALSTALFCMPYEEGLALAESIDGVHVLWIYESGEIKMTDGFKALTVE